MPSQNTTSDTPIVPPALIVDGNPDATVVRVPSRAIFEILAVGPPV